MKIRLERTTSFWDFYKTLVVQIGSEEYSLKPGQSRDIEIIGDNSVFISSGQLKSRVPLADVTDGGQYQIKSLIPNFFFILQTALIVALGIWTFINPSSEMMKINSLAIAFLALSQLVTYFIYRGKFYKLKLKR